MITHHKSGNYKAGQYTIEHAINGANGTKLFTIAKHTKKQNRTVKNKILQNKAIATPW